MKPNLNFIKHLLTRCKTTFTFHQRFYSKKEKLEKITSQSRTTHAGRLNLFLKQNPHIEAYKEQIPSKYLSLKRITPPDNIYLVDNLVAKKVAALILPHVKENPDQIICETNAGLGLISTELLENGVKMVRLYESCPDFKAYLRTVFSRLYPERIEMFTKDIFLLQRYDFMDRQDNGNRVQQLINGLPLKRWNEEPAMTIIGTLPHTGFIRFLIKSLVLQSEVVTAGRIQLFAFIRPRDYVVLTAGPHLNLHTYQSISVLFNLFFECELLDKFKNEIFLPWISIKKPGRQRRYATQIDPDLMYFVRINFKKDLPLSTENILPFNSFINQFFARGAKRVVPEIEKWVPGAGLHIICPKLKHQDYYEDMGIYTRFGDLNPDQLISVFREMMTHPEYLTSPFMSMVESQLIKTETIETSLDEQLEQNIIKDIEVKMD